MSKSKTSTVTPPPIQELRARYDVNLVLPTPPAAQPVPQRLRIAVTLDSGSIELELPCGIQERDHMINSGNIGRLLELVTRREWAAVEAKELDNRERNIRLEAEALRRRDAGGSAG